MKKHFFPIMCAFLVLLSSTAHAATRAAAVVPRISFNGTTASCTVFVAADRPTDDIEAVIKLWQGSKCIETWEASYYERCFQVSPANLYAISHKQPGIDDHADEKGLLTSTS